MPKNININMEGVAMMSSHGTGLLCLMKQWQLYSMLPSPCVWTHPPSRVVTKFDEGTWLSNFRMRAGTFTTCSASMSDVFTFYML